MPVTNRKFQIFPKPRPFFCVFAISITIFCLKASIIQAQELANDELSDMQGDASLLSDDYALQQPIPEVLTTTRLRQPKSRVPGTTSIISGELIRNLGIMNLVEVFRLVPGMTVNYVGSNQPVTSYHGTVHYEQRRMQVQVDGRTAYRANLSLVEWNTMPVPLELIERIEVSRGPNSAAYGINAFLGTINIITRAPEDTSGVELRAISGSRGYGRAFGSVGGSNDDNAWRLAYEKRRSDGFDELLDFDENNKKKPFNDGYDINTLNYDSTLTFNPTYSLDLRGGVVDGVDENDNIKEGKLGFKEHPDALVNDYYLQTRLDVSVSPRHFFHIQTSFQNYKRRQRWTTCIPNDQFMQVLGGNSVTLTPCKAGEVDPLLADLNDDIEESRLEFEIQNTLLFNPDLKLVTGLGHRKDTYNSDTFFNGRGNNYQSRVFGNLEYSPLRWLTLNAGGNWEKTTTTDDRYFSPRVAANFILNDNQALRFVFSQAVRTPDAFEQDPDWSYLASNVAPPFSFIEGERFRVEDLVNPANSTYGKTLKEERITSREISYFGQFYLQSSTLALEARYFNDTLRDMISGVLTINNWNIDNNVALDQEGFELEASFEFPGTTFRFGYAYLDQDSEYTGEEISAPDKQNRLDLLGRLSVEHSGSVALIQQLPYNLTASTAFYWADQFRFAHFERADFRLSKRVFAQGYGYELALTMQHYVTAEPTLSPDNKINDHNQFFVEAGVRF
jgi:iron complex outermembrane receptor protein